MYYGAAGLYYGLMKLIERDKAPSFGEIVKDLETRMSTGKGGNKYFLGSIRTLDTLQDFSVATRRNEGAHALGTFIPLPFMIKMLPFLLTHPETAIPTYIIYLLNAYATFLQRYNRARVENTIDLKLGRGPFKLDITTADTTDDKPTP